MKEQSKKGVRTTALAIVIAGLAISASVLFAASSYRLGVTRTVTETATSTVAPSSIQLHKVTFNETGINCGWGPGLAYIDMWYVTLGNVTIGQPSNATLPFPDRPGAGYAPLYAMTSKIIFTVPDGSYRYHVSLGPLGGTVNVNGSDVAIQVNSYPLC
jgi:hypothetical protein